VRTTALKREGHPVRPRPRGAQRCVAHLRARTSSVLTPARPAFTRTIRSSEDHEHTLGDIRPLSTGNVN
jgi:hypothetical protein